MGWTFYSVALTVPVLAFMLLGPQSVSEAYPTPTDYRGDLLRWDIEPDSGPLYYEITADDENDLFEYESTILDAAALWSDVSTSYVTFAPVEESEDGTPSRVMIYLERDFDGGSSSAGYARFDDVDDNGRPKHCEVHIAMGLGGIPKTILHELGHCLGLGHSLVPEAVMSYRDSNNGFFLDTDDQAAISRLYPADGSKPKLPPGCAIGTDHQGQVSALLTILLAPLMLLSLMRRGRKQHSRPL